MKITILDPAMCCSTGVCGTEVDDSLVETAAHVKWLKSLGHEVNRHNISNDAASFKQYPFVIEKLQKEGIDSLPYILVNDQLVLSGSYPSKRQWETWIAGESVRPDVNADSKSSVSLNPAMIETLVAIGAAMAACCETSLKQQTKRAKNLGIDMEQVVMAMNVGNKIRVNSTNQMIDQANSLLKEMQPAAATCSGSGCC